MSLKFVEPRNLKECFSLGCPEDCSQIPLFHGTRMYALQAGKEERERFYTACDRVITFAKKLLKNRPFDDTAWEEYLKKNPMFLWDVVSQYKTSSFSYGSFYVTTGYPTALNYACNCGGELGQWAYAQCIGFRDFQIELDPETAEAAAIVMEEYQKYENSEPVLLVFTEVQFADLHRERGGPFFHLDENGNVSKEDRAMDLSMYYQSKVTDTTTCAQGFRLLNPEAYTAYLVRQKDFKNGFSLFTQVRDLEYYLKWHVNRHVRDLL